MTTTEPRLPSEPDPNAVEVRPGVWRHWGLYLRGAADPEPQPLTAAVRTAFIAVTRKHVSSPEAGADSVDVAIASALRDAEEAVLRYLDAARAVPALDAEHDDHLRARLTKMDETYHDRWPRWTDRDYYAVRALLNGSPALSDQQSKGETNYHKKAGGHSTCLECGLEWPCPSAPKGEPTE